MAVNDGGVAVDAAGSLCVGVLLLKGHLALFDVRGRVVVMALDLDADC